MGTFPQPVTSDIDFVQVLDGKILLIEEKKAELDQLVKKGRIYVNHAQYRFLRWLAETITKAEGYECGFEYVINKPFYTRSIYVYDVLKNPLERRMNRKTNRWEIMIQQHLCKRMHKEQFLNHRRKQFISNAQIRGLGNV